MVTADMVAKELLFLLLYEKINFNYYKLSKYLFLD